SGQLTQVLLVTISLRPLLSEIEFIKVDQGGCIFVVNRSGLLLVHSDHSQVLARADFRQNPQVATFMQKKPVTPPRRYLNQVGRDVIGAAVETGMPDWLVVTEIGASEALAPLKRQQRILLQLLAGVVLGALLLVGYFLFFMIRPLRRLENGVQAISRGHLEVRIAAHGESEIATVGRAFNEMAANLQAAAAEKAEQVWFAQGQVLLDEALRGSDSLAELSARILSFYADYLKLPIGALFVNRKDDVFTCTAGYAVPVAEIPSFKRGEGLIGQAAVDQRSLTFAQVPESCFCTRSALLEQPPEHLMILPLIHNQETVAVFEFGSFFPVVNKELLFLEQSAPILAISLFSARGRLELEEALLRASTLTDELQTQQEELRVANEELETQQEELRVSNEELEARTQSLENNNREMEKKNLELKKAQEYLEQKSREVEVASRYKSEFLANMSHELRTPLNSLLILSQNLKENKTRNLSSEQVEEAEIIYSCGHDLLKLINDILDLAKIEAGKMSLRVEPVEIGDLAQLLITQFKGEAEKKGLDLLVEIDAGLVPVIETDQQRLVQILRNLIANALKFTMSGRVTVRFHKPEETILAGYRPEEVFAIAVIDTGIGIPEAQQREIFEAFKQVDGGISRQFGGTGLGLSISRNLARLLGGEIALQSQPGTGSTFTLHLPEKLQQADDAEAAGAAGPARAARKQERPGPSPAVVPAAPKPARRPGIKDDRDALKPEDESILIIEDDLNFAKILCNYSHERGFRCLHAADAESGLADALQYLPAAIILDLHLPGMSGQSLLGLLKERLETRHIPVHIMSADVEHLELYRQGIIGYLQKPVARSELDQAFAKIEELLQDKVRHLLLVEDDPIQSQSILKLIGNGDVVTTVVSGVAQALEKLRENHFDCMILDLKLADGSGQELLEKLSACGQEIIPPVIIYTSREMLREEEAALRKYASSIIIKGPYSQERLLDETALFLHRVVKELPPEKQQMIGASHALEMRFVGRKILLVDDDMRNVFALAKVLRDVGLEVEKAVDGEKALKILDEHPDIDIVLMDIMMPVMDGYAAMRAIRKRPGPLGSVPIIALTAKAMPADREQCLEAGANDYLAKPIDVEKLFSLIRVWLKD
ncbi:MAG: response regulator, partial [Deltaproteobacteria bacterium]|nr:response regulator [Deltaproteobacteria bacterium]